MRFSPRKGDSLHRFTSKLAGPTGTWVRLAVQNFTSIGIGGGNAAPTYEKFPLFGKESPHRDEPLDRFLKLYGFLYAQLSCITVSNLTWFASPVTESLLRNRASVIYAEFFRAHCRKNYAMDRKMVATFLMASTCFITVQSLGGDRTTRAGCRWENMVFVCLFVTLRV